MPFNPYGHPARLAGQTLDAAAVYFDHFLTGVTQAGHKFATTADQGDWLVSADAGGTNPGVQDDAQDGWILWKTDGDSGDVVNIQLNGEPFKLTSGRRLAFALKIKPASVNADHFYGLATAGTDLYTSPVNDMVGFEIDGDASIDVITRKDGSETKTDTEKDIAASTEVELMFEYDGVDSVKFYVDGEEVVTHTQNIPDDEAMAPALVTESNGAEETVEADYILVNPDAS